MLIIGNAHLDAVRGRGNIQETADFPHNAPVLGEAAVKGTVSDACEVTNAVAAGPLRPSVGPTGGIAKEAQYALDVRIDYAMGDIMA
jgi:hypothetical protein